MPPNTAQMINRVAQDRRAKMKDKRGGEHSFCGGSKTRRS
jgi:hypothetical protein